MAYSPIEQNYLNMLADSVLPPPEVAEPSVDGMQLAAGPSDTRTDAPRSYGSIRAVEPTTFEKALQAAGIGLEQAGRFLDGLGQVDVPVLGPVSLADFVPFVGSAKPDTRSVMGEPDWQGTPKVMQQLGSGQSIKGQPRISSVVGPDGLTYYGTSGSPAMLNEDASLAAYDALPLAQGAKTGANLVKNGAQKFVRSKVLNASDLKLLPENQRDTLIKMYDKALETKPKFDAIGQEIASQIGGEYIAGPIKKSNRVIEKTLNDYDGDVAKIKDLVRSTIIVDTQEQASKVIDLIRQHFHLKSEGFRNLLDESVDAPLGYRDAKMNVEINGMTAEIQVNYPEMLKAKDQMHDLYKEIKKIERSIMSRPDKQATAEELVRIQELEAKQKTGYDAAFSETIKRLNRSSETGAPLRRAESGSNGLGGDTSQAAQYGTASPAPIETGMPSTSKNFAYSGNFMSRTSDQIISGSKTSNKGAQ
ncbi:MAG: hypothetical protein EB015_17095 [Methylocystaceae bacterium]|nr:hypothetical protein [Methylocystaceae bacterium]